MLTSPRLRDALSRAKDAKPRRWSGHVEVKADKDGYGRPSLGGPIGYVGLGVVLFFMVGSQEKEIMIKKNGLALRMS